MASRLRQIVESMAETLGGSDYFNTSPIIPVVVEDSKDVIREIDHASGKAHGAFALVGFDTADTDNESPGPFLSECTFNVSIVEFPSIWRSSRRDAPSCTEIAEAAARLLHHTEPLDIDGNRIGNGVLSFVSMTPTFDESSLTQTVSFSFPLVLSTSVPTR